MSRANAGRVSVGVVVRVPFAAHDVRVVEAMRVRAPGGAVGADGGLDVGVSER